MSRLPAAEDLFDPADCMRRESCGRRARFEE